MLHEREVRRRVQARGVQACGSLCTLWLSASICGSNKRASYMAPRIRWHDLANADEILAMSIIAVASTYGMRMSKRTKGLVRDVCTKWRSTGDDGHTGVCTLVPMIDRKLLRHSIVSETVSNMWWVRVDQHWLLVGLRRVVLRENNIAGLLAICDWGRSELLELTLS